MCYSSPAKSLEIARERLTPEQWQRFERDFDDFCVVQGLVRAYDGEHDDDLEDRYDWAKWAFFQGRQPREMGGWRAALSKWLRGESGRHMASIAPKGATLTSHALQLRLWADQVEGLRYRHTDIDGAYFEKIGRAMMSDEQAEQSLERWMGRGE